MTHQDVQLFPVPQQPAEIPSETVEYFLQLAHYAQVMQDAFKSGRLNPSKMA